MHKFPFALAVCLAAVSNQSHAGLDEDSDSQSNAPYFNRYEALYNDAQYRSFDSGIDTSLKLSGQIQTRYTFNARDGQGSAGSVTNGFSARRTKLKASGRLGDPNIRFVFATAFSRSTGQMTIEDVYARFQLDENWMLKVGQFRPSVLREQIISSKYQLASERSLVSTEFGQSYNTGIALMYRSERFRATASVMDASPGFGGDRMWEYIVRAEYMLKGPRSSVSDFTSFRGDEPATMIGGGIGYLDTDPVTVGLADTATLTWSVDLTAEFGGSSLFAAVVGSQTNEMDSTTSNQYGGIVQGGLFVSDKAEIFARYSHGDNEANEQLSLLEAGVNYYINEHNAKVTLDAGYSFEEMTTAWRSAGAGWLRDAAGQDGQFTLRAQMQILF